MRAIVTGGAKGIGREMVIYLKELGFDILVIDKDQGALKLLKDKYKIKTKRFNLANENDVFAFVELLEKDNFSVFINNAAFGWFGIFSETSLTEELEMIDLNIKSYHILMKKVIQKYEKENGGYLLNVSSSAGFLCAPRMATYYATKNYITKLTIAVQEELRRNHSNVNLSLLCPGKVGTDFYKRAKGNIRMDEYSAKYVARYGIDQLFKQKRIIVPGKKMKLSLFLQRFISWKLLAKIMYSIHVTKN